MRVNKHYTLGVKESMPQFAFLIQAFIIVGVGEGGNPKQNQTKTPKLSWKAKYSIRPFASWGLMIPIQNCATFREAGKTLSFVGMKGWVSFDFSRVWLVYASREFGPEIISCIISTFFCQSRISPLFNAFCSLTLKMKR